MFEDLFSKRGLSMDRMHALLLLSESGSLIRAAKGDAGKQSRLSHRLRELSGFFGLELTEKSGKSIKLTASGEKLAQMTREHFLGLQAFRNQAAGVITTFRIAAGDGLPQWLVVPAIARIRRPNNPVRVKLSNLRTKEIVKQLHERQIEFGIMREDAVEEPLMQVRICEQRYAIYVPQRLVPSRGLRTVKEALLECPHASIGGDGQLMERLRELARNFGGHFVPELFCDSIDQCVAAVETGAFAALLPVQAWNPSPDKEYTVLDESLDALNRQIVLAWHPRSIDVMGTSAQNMQYSLLAALKDASEAAGASCSSPE
jgi:DNA-binding transcriptional LysR family regulator